MPSAIVLGSDRLGLRAAEQLISDGYDVGVVALRGSWLARAPAPPGMRVEVREAEDPAPLPGIGGADVLLAVAEEDELNLAAALAAREAKPRIRVVLRQFNTRLGALLGAYLPDDEVLSLSALSAPTFAVAALSEGVVFAHDCGAALFVLREVRAAEAAGMPILAMAREDGSVAWAPRTESVPPTARCLVASDGTLAPRHEARAGAAALAQPRGDLGAPRSLLVLTAAALVGLLLAGTLVFRARLGLSTLDAVYFMSAILTTVGFGDFNLRDADELSKAVGILLMFGGFFLGALLVAQLTDALVARQDARRRGHVRRRIAGHVVVCGLGSVGFRTAQALRRLGVGVVAVERDEGGRFVSRARSEGMHVVLGDACEDRTLAFAGVDRARCLVVATSRDHLNIEAALVGRSLAPSLPVVLRLFDADLGRRVASTFSLKAAFSAATLGAARFTAVGPNAGRLATLRFAGAAYELRQRAARPGETVADIPAPGRVVAVVRKDGRLDLDASASRALAAGEIALVVAPVGSGDGTGQRV